MSSGDPMGREKSKKTKTLQPISTPDSFSTRNNQKNTSPESISKFFKPNISAGSLFLMFFFPHRMEHVGRIRMLQVSRQEDVTISISKAVQFLQMLLNEDCRPRRWMGASQNRKTLESQSVIGWLVPWFGPDFRWKVFKLFVEKWRNLRCGSR